MKSPAPTYEFTWTAYDKGNCDYAQGTIMARSMTHAMQIAAAALPDEEPAYVIVSRHADR